MSYTRERLFDFSRDLLAVYNANVHGGKVARVLEQTSMVGPILNRDDDSDELFLAEQIAAHRQHELLVRSGYSEAPMLTRFESLNRLALGLTVREGEVMNGLVQGLSDAEIGMRLSCATKTVGKHVEHILAKLGAETRLAAVWTAQERLRAQHR